MLGLPGIEKQTYDHSTIVEEESDVHSSMKELMDNASRNVSSNAMAHLGLSFKTSAPDYLYRRSSLLRNTNRLQNLDEDIASSSSSYLTEDIDSDNLISESEDT